MKSKPNGNSYTSSMLHSFESNGWILPPKEHFMFLWFSTNIPMDQTFTPYCWKESFVFLVMQTNKPRYPRNKTSMKNPPFFLLLCFELSTNQIDRWIFSYEIWRIRTLKNFPLPSIWFIGWILLVFLPKYCFVIHFTGNSLSTQVSRKRTPLFFAMAYSNKPKSCRIHR
jgi:hypothetical protein